MAIIFSKEFSHGTFEVHNSKPKNVLFYKTKQIHSDVVIEIHQQISEELEDIEADGLIDYSKEKNLCVLSADCLPILFVGEHGHALLHAGWLGVKKQICDHPNLLKINPKLVFIGPHIQSSSFEVSEDFKDHFPNSPHFTKHGGKLFFNLSLEVKDQLKKKIPKIEIIISDIDTKIHESFHSYRRNKTILRNWNLFKIKKEKNL